MLQCAVGKDAIKRFTPEGKIARVATDEMDIGPALLCELFCRHQRSESSIDADGAEPGMISRQRPPPPGAAHIEETLAAGVWKSRNWNFTQLDAAVGQAVRVRDHRLDHRFCPIAFGNLGTDLAFGRFRKVDGIEQPDHAMLRPCGKSQSSDGSRMRMCDVGSQENWNAGDNRVMRTIFGDQLVAF